MMSSVLEIAATLRDNTRRSLSRLPPPIQQAEATKTAPMLWKSSPKKSSHWACDLAEENTQLQNNFKFKSKIKMIKTYSYQGLLTIPFSNHSNLAYGPVMQFSCMRSSRVVRVSGCQWQSRNSPIPASSDTVESQGRQMKQCRIKYIKIF